MVASANASFIAIARTEELVFNQIWNATKFATKIEIGDPERVNRTEETDHQPHAQ